MSDESDRQQTTTTLTDGAEIPFAPGMRMGDSVTFRKTVSESDVYLYAGITGDFSANHVDEEFMKSTPYGRRIAHGSLLVGFSSTASTKMSDKSPATSVSAGYDRIRFVGPVFLGDTVTTVYRIVRMDATRRRTWAEATITNQNGDVCAVCEHILQFI
jgi:3-hydroxybutyryl-CoA dehydratase